MTTLSQGALGFVLLRRFRAGDERGALQVAQDFARQLFHRGHEIGEPGVDRTPRHGIVFGRGRFLHQYHAGLFLDGAQTQSAVGTHAGKNHPDAVLLLILGEGAEEKIDRQAQPARGGRGEQMQDAVQNRHVLVRRNHIDAIGLDRGAIFDLDDLHAGAALKQLGHDPLLRGIQMLDDDKRHAALLRHLCQKLLEASRPPAEMPMPTMGNPAPAARAEVVTRTALTGCLSRRSGGDYFIKRLLLTPDHGIFRTGCIGRSQSIYADGKGFH